MITGAVGSKIFYILDASYLFQSTQTNLESFFLLVFLETTGHCKKVCSVNKNLKSTNTLFPSQIKPEFNKAAELMRTDDPPIALAKVDCTEAGKETCSKFSVSGYPTLKIFRNGEVSADYNGPREAGELQNYCFVVFGK